MAPRTAQAYLSIADYALIGDTCTAALVSRSGSIDWLCFPRFDSPAVFCRLLDARVGGFFRIGPRGAHRAFRAYLGPTNVLSTELDARRGRVRLTDFMPIRDGRPGGPGMRVLRLLEGLAGEVEVEIAFRPSFDFARQEGNLSPCPGGAIARGADQALRLYAPVSFAPDHSGALRGHLKVRAGDRRWFELCGAERGGEPAAAASEAEREQALHRTAGFWQGWAGLSSYRGPYVEVVQRSALALKLLFYRPTGALVAAPTTSLPEEIGGVRNWDYRYAWLRDSAMVLHALQSIGHREEATAFFHWLQGQCIECFGDLQLLYAVDGDPEVPEELLGHLEGYAGSRPVRVGNAAATQRQLDIYGEVLDAAYLYRTRIGTADPKLPEVLWLMANRAALSWHEPDEGIWEVRGGRQHFLYSKLMCWVAVDRALRMRDVSRRVGDVEMWEEAREELRQAILEQGYDPRLGAFTRAFGSEELDASALMIPLVGFLPATDPRVLSTVARIEERLTSGGMVYRYLTEDGLPGGEGAFVLCSLWLVDNLALCGRIEQARALYERVIGHANDVGLLAEQIDPTSGELLGNFPQGLTHLGVIESALNLEKAERAGPERHPRTFAERGAAAGRESPP